MDGGQMPIEQIHSFLIHPAKHAEEQPEISGSELPRSGQLYAMLERLFTRAPQDCDIEIVFRPNDKGEQQNVCRDFLVAYAQEPTLVNGRSMASRLQEVTTHRSGLGLLFLMKGVTGGAHVVVISRFPADQGVIATEHAQRLTVEFIERVFMKSAKAYKCAIYSSDSFERGFWDGRAVDHQISGPRELSDYWIRDFLISELRTTGPAGTKRLAVAIRNAIRTVREFSTRHELVSAASLLRGQHGQYRSARQLVEQIGLSDEAKRALEANFPRPDLMDEVFQFDRAEFQRHALYRAVELDNGGLLIAEDACFDEVFEQQPINAHEKRFRYTTEGRVVNEILRKTK
jgi:hypothetical protein